MKKLRAGASVVDRRRPTAAGINTAQLKDANLKILPALLESLRAKAARSAACAGALTDGKRRRHYFIAESRCRYQWFTKFQTRK
jgi:hypothetical protein